MNAYQFRVSRGPQFSNFTGIAKAPAWSLTDDAIAQIAPAVFADAAHESRSERFVYISTREILAGLRAEGFHVTAATQGKSRIPGKAAFTKHMLRLRHESFMNVQEDAYPEVVLINAHDGTSSYRAMAGIFRLVCSNGLVVMDEGGEVVRANHQGDVLGKVIEGSYRVINDAKAAQLRTNEWRRIELNRDEKMALAESAYAVRFGGEEDSEEADNVVQRGIKPEMLLRPRRREDMGHDLWTVSNVIQENAIRGGLRGRNIDADGRSRRVTTREIRSVDGLVNINRALWLLTERMAKLKNAA